MKITVITVCINAVKTIERTFQSVINQTEKKFEYLIIDGKSTDGTVDLIKIWEPKFKKVNIAFRWISEPDKGLYDAMNKGAIIAQGKWLIYLNADDEFANNQSIEYALLHLNHSIDILYGNTIMVGGNNMNCQAAANIVSITKHLPFIPQSAFVKTTIQRQFAFDLRYKISADYDSFLRMYIAGCLFKKVDYTFSKFYMGGVSNQNEWKTYIEDIQIKHMHKILNKKSPLQMIKFIRKYMLVKLKYMI